MALLASENAILSWSVDAKQTISFNAIGRVESGWLHMRDDTNDNCSCQRLLEKGKSSLVCVLVRRRLNKRVANRKTCLRFAKNGAETKKTCFSI